MAVTLVGSDRDGTADRTVTSRSVTIPAGVVAGDLIYIAAGSDNVSAHAAPTMDTTGYTLIDDFANVGSTTYHAAWYKVADNSDAGTTVELTMGVTNSYAFLRAYRGADTTTFGSYTWNETTSTGVNFDYTITGLGIDAGDLVVVHAFAAGNQSFNTGDSTYTLVVQDALTNIGRAGTFEAVPDATGRSSVTVSFSNGTGGTPTYGVLIGPILSESLIDSPTDERNRVRSSISEDAGSILDSASLNAVDASFSEAFLLDVSLPSTTAKNFVEALAPFDTAARYYPIPRQSVEFLNDYSGETILSRMTRVYPPAVVEKTEDYAPAGEQFTPSTTRLATPKGILTQLFTDWAALYSWFTYETVPDLRLKVMSVSGAGIMTPTEYATQDINTIGNGNTLTAIAQYGIIGSEVVFYPQDDDNRLTMRQMLDELLSPFPGTVVRANASGALEIVPTYGPDASNTAAVTLTTSDAYTVTQGQPSPKGIINSCIVNSQPYVWTEDAGAFNQSWFQVASNDFPAAELYATGTGENLSAEEPYPASWRPASWSMQANRFLDTVNGVKLTDSVGTPQVTIDAKNECGDAVSISVDTLTDIPGDGTPVVAIVGTGPGLRVEVSAQFNPDSQTVQLWMSGDNDFENTNLSCAGFGANKHVFRINLNDASDAWQAETTSVSGTYSLTESAADPIPTTDGANAVQASVTAYGEREARIDMTGYGMTSASVLEAVAKAYVLEAINPTLVRTVEQSVWRAFPVKFSNMGSVIELPSGEQGRLVNRTYSDDFGTNFGQGSIASTIKVEVIDQDGDGVIDVDTEYLLLDDGSAFVLDDDSQAEAG